MKVFKGSYRSETQGLCKAVWVELDPTTGAGIASLGSTTYTFYTKSSFIEDAPEVIAMPKMTDFFSQQLSEMTIKFKD